MSLLGQFIMSLDTDKVLYADSAYSGKELQERLPETVECRIHEKGCRNHPLTEEQKAELKFTVTTEVDGATKYVVYDEATAAEGNIHGKWAKLTEEEKEFTYKDFNDGMLVLENLPVGEYTVTETDGSLIEGYTWSKATVKVGRNGTVITKDEGETELTAEATLTTADFTQVFFENEYTQDVGELTVTKKVAMTEGSAAIDGDKTFRIAVYSEDEEGTKTYYATNGNVVTEDNKWVEFTADEEITWVKLPAGTYYVEEDPDGAKVDGYEVRFSTSKNCRKKSQR